MIRSLFGCTKLCGSPQDECSYNYAQQWSTQVIRKPHILLILQIVILPRANHCVQCKHEMEKMWYGEKKVQFYTSVGVLSFNSPLTQNNHSWYDIDIAIQRISDFLDIKIKSSQITELTPQHESSQTHDSSSKYQEKVVQYCHGKLMSFALPTTLWWNYF